MLTWFVIKELSYHPRSSSPSFPPPTPSTGRGLAFPLLGQGVPPPWPRSLFLGLTSHEGNEPQSLCVCQPSSNAVSQGQSEVTRNLVFKDSFFLVPWRLSMFCCQMLGGLADPFMGHLGAPVLIIAMFWGCHFDAVFPVILCAVGFS